MSKVNGSLRNWTRRGFALALAGLVAAGALASASADPPIPTPRPEPEPAVTLVRVAKADRRMELMAGDTVLRSYSIALGGNPVGHKLQEGDKRTPEGRYMLDWRNPNSQYYRSIHVSYPNDADRISASERGVDPGGDIMIHGQPNSFPLRSVGLPGDWTLGCIAVTNEEMDEIWSMVKDGTPIEIRP